MKNKFIKLIILTTILSISLIFITACGKQKSDDTLENIKNNHKLIVGTSPDYPPFEFISNGEVVGLDADFSKYIANDLNVELEIKQMDFGNLLNALETGMVDIVLAGMNPTDKNKQNADFSNIYYTTTLGVLTKITNDNIILESDLEGKTIGVQMGTTQQIFANKIKDANVVSLNTNPDIVMNIQANKMDCGLMETVVAKSFAEANKDLKVIENLALSQETGGIAIATKKNNENLLKELNRIIKNAQDANLIEEWFVKSYNLSKENIK